LAPTNGVAKFSRACCARCRGSRRQCARAYVDGSFVTSKGEPGDFDGCWDHNGVDFDALDPVLLDFDGHREAQKAKFEGEMFIADAPGNRFLEFFQLDRDGRPKGIIQINLADIAS
jgi:hypothetical protein